MIVIHSDDWQEIEALRMEADMARDRAQQQQMRAEAELQRFQQARQAAGEAEVDP